MAQMATQQQDMRNLRKKVYDRANDLIHEHQKKNELCDCAGCRFADELIQFISVDDNGAQLCLYCANTPVMVKKLGGIFSCPICGAKLHNDVS